MIKRLLGVICTTALALGGMVVLDAAPADAATALWVCDGAGNLYRTPKAGGGNNYTFTGTARCSNGDKMGPYIATFTGSGSSTTDGGCNGGLPIAAGVRIDVTVRAQSVSYPAHVRQESMSWKLLVSTYPQITPLLVYQNAAGTQPGNVLKGAANFLSTRTSCQGDLNSSGVLFDATWIDSLL